MTLIFSGTANPALSEKVAGLLNVQLGRALVSAFNDGETRVRLEQSVRGKRVFIIQPTCTPVNDNLFQLLAFIDATKRASAEKIVAVIPYFGYARQDYMLHPREPISGKLVADLLQTAGATSVMAVEVHSPKVQGFFDIPFDNIPTTTLACKRLSDLKPDIIVSPDAGGVKRAEEFAKRMQLPMAIIHKRRPKPGEAEVGAVIGDVSGKSCLMVDDMLDTGGSLMRGAEALKQHGATKVYAYAAHGIFSKNALDELEKSQLDKVFVTDTIPLKRPSSKIEQISIAQLLADTIRTIDEGGSLTPLFE